MAKSNYELKPYESFGLLPDYTFGDFEYYLTCVSFPEQYDVVSRTSKMQVAYIRLRGGRLYCSVPDVGGQIVYYHEFDEYIGEFYNEEDRLKYLTSINKSLTNFLDGVCYGYS